MTRILLALILSLALTTITAQQKKCEYDFEEKTDSTFLKKTPDYLVHEKDFTNSKDFLLFSLLNSNGTPCLNVQLLQKSKDFIKPNCFDTNSKISIQLTNGKIVTLLSAGEMCSQLMFDENEKNNIRLLSNYFFFAKEGFEDLKKYPVSIIKINFVSEAMDYVFKKQIQSETFKGEFFPENYFINYLNCVE